MRPERTILAIAAIGFSLAGSTAFSTDTRDLGSIASTSGAAPTSAEPSDPAAVTPEAAAAATATPGTAAAGAPANATRAPAVSAEAAFVARAVDALAADVGRLSSDAALGMAFRAWFSYTEANPGRVTKPYFYFVDYGQDSRAARGFVFDMERLEIVEGPFPVAHGRGSSKAKNAVPTKFSNVSGSATTSLGLYVGAELYGFTGKAGGRVYHATGMRMDGVSGRFNSAARARRIVAHGAPYVTATAAGRSEGCPAMDPARAKRLLPLIANGGLIFLYSPNEQEWVENDPWAGTGA